VSHLKTRALTVGKLQYAWSKTRVQSLNTNGRSEVRAGPTMGPLESTEDGWFGLLLAEFWPLSALSSLTGMTLPSLWVYTLKGNPYTSIAIDVSHASRMYAHIRPLVRTGHFCMVRYSHHTLLSIDSLLSSIAIYTASHTHVYPVFLYAMLSALHTLASHTLLSLPLISLQPSPLVSTRLLGLAEAMLVQDL
jgi:hypothetical protein